MESLEGGQSVPKKFCIQYCTIAAIQLHRSTGWMEEWAGKITLMGRYSINSFQRVIRCHYDLLSYFPLVKLHSPMEYEGLNLKYCHKNILTSHCRKETVH